MPTPELAPRFLLAGRDDPSLTAEQQQAFEMYLLVTVETLKKLGVPADDINAEKAREIAFKMVLDKDEEGETAKDGGTPAR